jgi:hypothetical protein
MTTTEVVFTVDALLESFYALASTFASVKSTKMARDAGARYVHQILEYQGAEYSTKSLASEIALLMGCQQIYPVVSIEDEKLKVMLWVLLPTSGKRQVYVIEYERENNHRRKPIR